MYKHEKTVYRRWLTGILAAILTAGTAGATDLAMLSLPCQSPVSLQAGETWRDAGGADADGCFEIETPAAGLLLVELSTPEATDAPPRLVGPRADKLAPPGEEASLLKSSAASRLVSVAEAGAYRLNVTAGDPWAAMPSYKLRTTFLEHGGHDFKENEGELEDEPDPLVAGTGTFTMKENEGELEDEPDPLLSGPLGGSTRGWDVYDLAMESADLRRALGELCGRGEADDHGESILCATPMGPDAAVGEIGNGWDDDADVFRFDLALPRTVEISTHGATDTAGELYDRFGNRLERATGGGEDGNFRMVRTLSPGVYFVRVAGEGHASGPYALTVRSSLR